MTDIDLTTAKALVDRGWAVVPTNSNGEKRPMGRFSTAKSWRDFGDRLPTDAELREWFGTPRRGGVVLHKGQLVEDYDTKDAHPAEGLCFEETDHGYHVFYRCRPDERIGHDHAGKIDHLTYGSFVRLCDPGRLLDWQGDLPTWNAAQVGAPRTEEKPNPPLPNSEGSIWATLQAAGWKAGAQSGDWIPITNGTKTAAISANGEHIKVFSTSIWEAPAPEPVAPAVTPAAELVASSAELPEAILPYCRRGSLALISANPKAGKTVLAIRTALKAAAAGRRVMYADLENGSRLWAHRARQYFKELALPEGLWYLDCTEHPNIDYIAAGIEAVGGVDLLFIDPWGLLIAGDGVEDESSNALVSQYFLKVRRALRPFSCATVILHHQPKSGADGKICFSGAGASSLQRYVQSICRIREDANGNFWFEALCREFDTPFKPVMVRRATG